MTDFLLRAALVTALYAASGITADWVDFPDLDGCTECAELCPDGSRDLPADHPDFCDGGPL